VATVNDPGLGPCTVLPIRRGPVAFWALVFVVMALAGPIVLWIALFQPEANLNPVFVLMMGLCTVSGPSAAFGQIRAARSPYFAIIGPNGSACSGMPPVRWADVVGIEVRTYRGTPIRLAVRLRKPRDRTLIERIGNLFGCCRSAESPQS
jgi:hypothetical protein